MLITLSDGQVITIANWYSSYSSRIEQFEFADGTVWESADILSNMVITGAEGDGNVYNQQVLNQGVIEGLVRINEKGIIDPGWLPRTPTESVDNLNNGMLSSIITNAYIEEQESLEPISSMDTLEGLVRINEKGIIDPGWLPRTPAESVDNSNDTELDSAFNQLVQAHSSFGDVGDDTGFGKKDDGYRYILPVPEPLIKLCISKVLMATCVAINK